MLSTIREKATGIFAWLIVGLISIPFALWGINSYFEGGGQAVVATVNGVDIDLNTYQQALSERRRVMAQIMQQGIDSDFLDSDVFKRQVLDGLIQNVAESSHADLQGYRIGSDTLGHSIRQLPYFQVDGQFDSERYVELVQNAGMNVGRFEQQQRQQMVAEQIRSAYTESVFVTDADLDQVLQLMEQSRTADYAVLSVNDPSIEVELDDSRVADYYERNKERFIAPEQMRVNYVVLSIDKLAADIEVDENEIQQSYEDNVGRYGKPAERRVSHVLVQVPADADEAALGEAETRAQEIADRARGGEDFAALATELSDDSGSAANGGDLGVITRGAMVQPFEDAVFAMQAAGEVAGPVRTRFGFHVIKMTDFTPAQVAPIEEVRDEIRQDLERRYAEQRYLELADRFANLAYEQPESLDPVAEELQLELQSSDWFGADSGEGMAVHPRFRQAAFGEDVKIEGLNSEAFEIDGSMMVSVHRLEVRDRRQRTLDEVRDDVEAALRRELKAEAVAARGQEIVGKLDSGADWQSVVAEYGLDAVEFYGVREDAVDPESGALVDAIFAIAADQLPVAGGTATVAGDYLVYRLTAIEDGSPEAVDEARREALRQLLAERHGNEIYFGYQDALRAGAEVTVVDEQL